MIELEAGRFARVFVADWMTVPDDWEPMQDIGMIYADPPWGDGNVKYYETFASRAGVPRPGRSWLEIVTKILRTAEQKGIPCVIEHSLRKAGELELLAPTGLPHRRTFDLQCNFGRYAACVFGPKDVEPLQTENGMEAVTEIVRQLNDGRAVMDPCCGLGRLLSRVRVLGLPVLGVELNPARAQHAVHRLARIR